MRLLQRFWTLEEIPKFIRQSTKHDCDSMGRYIVPLPIIREELPSLGESLENVRRALASVQQRMLCDPHLQKDYAWFMKEYVETGHIRRLTEEELASGPSFVNYLPHHGIWQRQDRGRKLQDIFNASCPTSSGRSLNDILRPGPKVQSDLTTVITRWRRWAVAFCADIRMMFRQIWADSEDTHLQRIIWSPSTAEPAATFCAPWPTARPAPQTSHSEPWDSCASTKAVPSPRRSEPSSRSSTSMIFSAGPTASKPLCFAFSKPGALIWENGYATTSAYSRISLLTTASAAASYSSLQKGQ